MAPLVSRAVTKYINLNVAEQVVRHPNQPRPIPTLPHTLPQVVRYPGPVRLLRRNRDEMISTVEGELWSNRGNALLQVTLPPSPT